MKYYEILSINESFSLSAVFDVGNHVHTAFVLAAFKIGSDKCLHQLPCQTFAQNTRAQADNIGIVVETGELGRENIGTARRTDSLDLVRRHTHADPGTAAEDAQIRISFGQVSAGLFRINGVVAAFGGIGTHIGNGITFRGEESDQSLLEGVACMVCGNNNSSFFHIFR